MERTRTRKEGHAKRRMHPTRGITHTHVVSTPRTILHSFSSEKMGGGGRTLIKGGSPRTTRYMYLFPRTPRSLHAAHARAPLPRTLLPAHRHLACTPRTLTFFLNSFSSLFVVVVFVDKVLFALDLEGAAATWRWRISIPGLQISSSTVLFALDLEGAAATWRWRISSSKGR